MTIAMLHGRRILAPLAAALLLLAALTVFAGRARAAGTGVLLQLPVDSTAAFVNGSQKALDVPAQIQDGRTLVPLRFVGESLGATVGWDGDKRMVTYTLGNTQINLVIDDTHARVNGADVTLDVPPRIVNSRTMVPVRFVSERLGAAVGWEADARTVWVGVGDVPNLVLASGFRFTRTDFSISAGTPLVFINSDRAIHTVTGNHIDSGDLASGDAFVLRNLPPGAYTIHCMHHPSMTSSFTITP